MRALLFLAAACSLTAAEDPREIVRRSVELMDRNLAVARNYTFLERSEVRELDGDGRVKSRKIRQYDVTLLEGSPYRRLVGRDDHPLPPEEDHAEEKKLKDSIAARQKESAAQREKRVAEWQKKSERQRESLREIPDAFDYRIVGNESIEGRDAWLIEATPHRGYGAKTSLAKFFPKLRGKLWIDKLDYQWVRTQAEATDTISYGLLIARLAKGARLDFEMTRVNNEVWLPSRITASGSARIALFKKFRIDSDTTYSKYRKFQADSRIVSVQPSEQ
ncbi:MAG: hypothetical protein U0Q18_06480 [Bryobacteraceae bacterium]